MEDKKEKLPSTNINWYPGHMAKTKREIINNLKLIDIVIELLDARIPIASRNPDIYAITKNKKKIILLNKADLSDPKTNEQWVNYFSKEAPTILTDASTGKGINKITSTINELMQDEIAKQQLRGLKNKTIRIMILGIPNVGKSSLINRLAKRNTAVVANRPGVTQNNQWIRIANNQELLDTPGVLWPKFESDEVALNLAFTGTIKDDILQRTEIAYELLKRLYQEYPNELKERYKLQDEDIKEIEQSKNFIYKLMLLIGSKRGALLSGGKIDEEKTARIILEDFRSGKIGKISLEKPKK